MSISLQREQSQSQIYLLVGGWKLAISSGDITPLGLDLSKVQVVNDGALAGIRTAPLGPPVGMTKASDAHITSPSSPSNNCTDARGVVKRDILVAGWLSATPWRNMVMSDQWGYGGIEDYHYDPILDVDFMLQMYGPGGLSTALAFAVLPGHLSDPDDSLAWPGPSLPFADRDPVTGNTRGITLNSFALPHMGGGIMKHDFFQADAAISPPPGVVPLGTDPLGVDLLGYGEVNYDYLQAGPIFIHGELNTWHINYQGAPPLLGIHFDGRGAPPAGWVIDPFDANAAHPFLPLNPDGGPRNLVAGDYVLMRGTLFEEHAHDYHAPESLWRTVPGLLGHVGVLEMHPIDWIKRVDPPARPTTAYAVACCNRDPSQVLTTRTYDFSFWPYPKLAQSPGASQLHVTELIDGRYTDLSTLQPPEPPVLAHAHIVDNQRVAFHVTLNTTASKQGHFKAVYLSWWAAPNTLAVGIISPVQVSVGSPTILRLHAEDSTTGATVSCHLLLAGQDRGLTDSDIRVIFEHTGQSVTVHDPDGRYPDAIVPFPLQPGAITITQITGVVPRGATTLHVSAQNAAGEPLSFPIWIRGAQVGMTNQDFVYNLAATWNATRREYVYPTGTIRAQPDYVDTRFDFGAFAEI
jgi:hypothetical protein